MAVCVHSKLPVKASRCSVIHLLRQREMELSDCCIEKLGGKIARSIIIQV